MKRYSTNRLALYLGIAGLLLGSLACSASAKDSADWPQWRGPQRDGKAPDVGLLREWPEGGPSLAWRSSGLGGGYSSVAVAGERIFTMGDLEDAQYVIALGREDGKLLWKTKIGPKWEDKYLGPRSTPTVDGQRIYVLNTEGVVACLDAASGEKIWSRELVEEFGGSMMSYEGKHNWKYAESPLVDGKAVIVTPGAKDAAMVALDKKTGEEIWRTAIPVLGEKVGWRRWTAIGIGFLGVLVILQPGVTVFSVAALVPLASAMMFAASRALGPPPPQGMGHPRDSCPASFSPRCTALAATAPCR